MDTDAMFDEAVGLAGRVEKLELLGQKLVRLARDKELVLLSNGFMPDAAPEVRIAAVARRASQIVEEENGDLWAQFDAERAAINGMRASYEAIVATGWADNFANAYWRRSDKAGIDKSKRELDA
jgi:hypothetical protein